MKSYGGIFDQDNCAKQSEIHYAICFPIASECSLAEISQQRISFAEAVRKILACVTGGEAKEAEALKHFTRSWQEKFRSISPSDSDSIPRVYFDELMREIVISKLNLIEGLIVHTEICQEWNRIVCTLKGTPDLMMNEADRNKIKLQLWPEIDPGPKYWLDEKHLAQDNQEWSRDDAEEELYRMFLSGEITADDAQIFEEETPFLWSKRLNALRRKKDTFIRENRHNIPNTFLPYSKKKQYKYLYSQIEGNLWKTPFRNIERIRLVKSAIDKELDCDTMLEEEIICDHLCFHTYESHEEETSLEILLNDWGKLTSPMYLFRNGIAPWYSLLSYQPLTNIRGYFGEEIALYFAMLSFYAEKVLFLGALGIISLVLEYSNSFMYKYFTVAYALVNCLYSVWMIKAWEERQYSHALSWGVHGIDNEDSATRPQFRGKTRLSPINNRPEIYSSMSVQVFKKILSGIFMTVIVGILLLLNLSIFYVRHKIDGTKSGLTTILSRFLIAILIPIAGIILGPVAISLNNWENYRTQAEYDFNLTLKYCFLQTFNYYGSLLIDIFLSPSLFGCPSNSNRNCLKETEKLLLCILLVNLFVSGKDVIMPCVESYFNRLKYRKNSYSREFSSISEKRNNISINLLPMLRENVVEKDLNLASYEGVLEDYAQVVLIFGYICCFGCTSGVASIIAYVMVISQIRIDAYKLCYLLRRPFPKARENIGTWYYYFIWLSFFGTLTNPGIVVVSTDLLKHVHGTQKLFYYVILAQVFIFLWLFVSNPKYYLHDGMIRLRNLEKRADFLFNMYFHPAEDNDKELSESIPSGQVFLNGIYRHVITGNQLEEDKVEELCEHLLKLQVQKDSIEKQIGILREDNGDIMFYIHVHVGNINILPVMDRMTKALDPYVKIKFLVNGKLQPKGSKKTDVIKGNRSPSWEHEFKFSLKQLDDAILQFTIMDWDMLGRNDKVGEATLNISNLISISKLDATAFHNAENEVKSSDDVLEIKAEGKDSKLSSQKRKKFPLLNHELLIDMDAKLQSSMEKDIQLYGHPKLSIKVGIEETMLGNATLEINRVNSLIESTKESLQEFHKWNN